MVFSQTRSGSTALVSMLIDYKRVYHPYINECKKEYLDVVDRFYPRVAVGGTMWTETVDRHYESGNWEWLNSYYQSVDHSDCHFQYPVLKADTIEALTVPWHQRELLHNHSTVNEQQRRIKLLQQCKPWVIKILDYQIQDLSWIDRTNTTVIVLVRNNILDRAASLKRNQITGVCHGTDASSVVVDDPVSLADVQKYIELAEVFKQRAIALQPDAVVSYEWCEKFLFSHSKMTKLNLQPVEDFIADYDQAVELVKNSSNHQLELFNEKLVLDIIK